MKKLFLAVVLALLFPGSARADDLCVRYECSVVGGTPSAVETTSIEGASLATGLPVAGCKCVGYLHVPTAKELGNTISDDVKQAIVQSMKDAVKAALLEIQKDNAIREQRIYDRIAEIQKANDAQIKLLTAIVSALSGVKPPAPPPDAPKPSGDTEPKKPQPNKK